MLQLRNETSYQAERGVLLDKDGNHILTVITKATWKWNEEHSVDLHPDQEPVRLFPIWAGEPGKSSLLRECEMVAEHPGTDITLNATAYAPQGKMAKALDVNVTVGKVSKSLRIFGDRHWEKGLLGPKMSDPDLFDAMPIVYERAFGGTIPGGDNEVFAPRNPIGKGFIVNKDEMDGTPLPNIQDPDNLIEAWKDRPTVAGFGAIPAMWEPRKGYGGTYDKDWKRNRSPLWPEDCDPRHHQSANPAMVSQEPLMGGERAKLRGLTPEQECEFKLPRIWLTVTARTKTTGTRMPVQLDRVIIEPNDKKFLMVWRASLNCRSDARRVSEIIVATKPMLR
jgi:hypothetical protein